MEDNKFNNYSLSNDEVTKILKEFRDEIRVSSVIFGRYNEDCEQEIRLQIYKALTKNKKIFKNATF